MNNRVQQRFDRSVREAVKITKQATENESKTKAQEIKIKQANALLPVIIKALQIGILKGEWITREQRKQLKEMKAEYEKLIGAQNG